MAHIFQINTSPGGLPKHGTIKADVTGEGIIGDQHRDMVHHGGPNRALCLYALEHIQALQAEGHPVFPGAMGENLTLSGMAWEQIIPGVKLKLGDSVVLEVTDFTVPCNHLKPFFIQADISRVGQKTRPGWSRVYARVVQGGTITVGDRVEFLLTERVN
jgi:MOSC domain-containing protein YiiM